MACANGVAFCAPLVPRVVGLPCVAHTRVLRRLPAAVKRTTGAVRITIVSQHASHAPDYSSGFSPESDADYEEVRVFSFGPSRNDSCLLTLSPVCGGKYAFKMCVTSAQAESIRASFRRNTCCNSRPSTHDLFNKVLRMGALVVVKAAITHIHDDVFIARVWFNMAEHDDFNVDCRPSDAIALALRSNAPLYLNINLLKQWNVEIEAIKRDARHGVCEQVSYEEALKTSSSIREEVRHKPEHIRLAILKMRLDVAVRTERYAEAAALKTLIDDICPIDTLQNELRKAVSEQRFLDAACIHDRITVWRARLRMWEKGSIDLERWDAGAVEGEDDVDAW
ncbi:unnamed protein product [Agarophyton chilense]